MRSTLLILSSRATWGPGDFLGCVLRGLINENTLVDDNESHTCQHQYANNSVTQMRFGHFTPTWRVDCCT